MCKEKDFEIKFLSKTDDSFYVEKKVSLRVFIGKEILVFICIALASYFSIFISSKKLATEESFSKQFNLVFEFFTFENQTDTSIGLLIMIGIICSINHLSTHSKLNIQPILNRLIISIVDFYYLMFSTIFGCMLGLLHFLNNFPNIDKYAELYQLAITGIITIGIFGSITSIATRYLINKDKILHMF